MEKMEKIIIKGKEYELKMPSLGVLKLITLELKEIIKKISKDFKNKTIKDMTEKMTISFFNLFIDEKNEELVLKICKIVALYLNNKNPANYTEEDLTAEDIMWNLPVDNILKILEKLVG